MSRSLGLLKIYPYFFFYMGYILLTYMIYSSTILPLACHLFPNFCTHFSVLYELVILWCCFLVAAVDAAFAARLAQSSLP